MTVGLCPSWCLVTDIDSVHAHGRVDTLVLAEGASVSVGALILSGTSYVQIRFDTGQGDLRGQDLTCEQTESLIAALLAASSVVQYPAGAMPCDLTGDSGHTTCVRWVPVAAPALRPHDVPVVRVERPRRRWARPRIVFGAGDTRAVHRLTRAETNRLIDMLIDRIPPDADRAHA